MCCENCYVLEAQLEDANRDILALKTELAQIKEALNLAKKKLKELKNANL